MITLLLGFGGGVVTVASGFFSGSVLFLGFFFLKAGSTWTVRFTFSYSLSSSCIMLLFFLLVQLQEPEALQFQVNQYQSLHYHSKVRFLCVTTVHKIVP